MGNFIYIFASSKILKIPATKDKLVVLKSSKIKVIMKITLTEKITRAFSFFNVFSAFESLETLQGRNVFVVKCHVLDS